MAKKITSLFFSITFLVVIVMPTILVLVDETFDTSIVISISEEEQEKEGEKVLAFKLLLPESNFESINSGKQTLKSNNTYCNRTYNTPHLNIISPPPEYTYL